MSDERIIHEAEQIARRIARVTPNARYVVFDETGRARPSVRSDDDGPPPDGRITVAEFCERVHWLSAELTNTVRVAELHRDFGDEHQERRV